MLDHKGIDFVLFGEWQEARKNPCNECPWRRRSIRGWTGPIDPIDWVDQAHGDGPIHCHKTITDGMDLDDPDLVQCAGAARFRANVFKNPRNPTAAVGPRDKEKIFASNAEFLEHHGGNLA